MLTLSNPKEVDYEGIEFDFRWRFAGRRKQRASTVSGLMGMRKQKHREVRGSDA